MYLDMFGQMKKQLGQLDTWLAKATGHAETKKFDVNVLMTQRLAPDQFAFARQVQITCDTAKLGASRITGKDAPSHDDSEATIAELRARISATIDYLDGFGAKDFADVEGRTVTQARWEGQVMATHDYFVEHVIPNFYFHLTHVYAILRHSGVQVGKRDYLGTLSKRAPQA